MPEGSSTGVNIPADPQNNLAIRVERLYLHCTVSLFKVDEGVVFELLNPLQVSELTEGRLQDLLCDAVGEVSNKQHLHLHDGDTSEQFTFDWPNK